MIPKFRAWIKKEKRMINVDFIDFYLKEVGEEVFEYGDVLTRTYNFKNIELMQSTGLKDKNGKEIFEGDIVEMFGATYTIEKDYDNCRFCMNGIDNINYGKDSLYLCKFKLENIKIIGNIYENPELLKGGNKSDKN